MNQTATAFDRWIHASFPASAEGLALYRMFFASFALLVESPGHDLYTNLRAAAVLPDSLFLPPPGPMMLFGGFPGLLTVEAIHLGLSLSLALLFVGYRTKLVSLITATLLFITYGFSYSFGKIAHNFLFAVVPLVMAFSGWGSAASYDAVLRHDDRQSVRAWPLTMLALLLGFGMFTAGFAKLVGGWLDPTSHATYGHIVKQVFVRGRTALLAENAMAFDHGMVWEILDYSAVLFELSFLAAVSRGRVFRFYVAGAVLFHFGIMLTMNIAFAFQMALYGAFLNWGRLAAVQPLDFIRRKGTFYGSRISRMHKSAALLVTSTAVGIAFYLYGSPLLLLDAIFPLESDLTAKEVTVVAGAAVGVVIWLTIKLIREAAPWAFVNARAAR